MAVSACYETNFHFDGVPDSLTFAHSIPHRGGYDGASMNQAIMQGPSVCVLILQQAAFLAAEWEVVIQRKSAGCNINEISICVMLFGRHPSCEHVE